MCSDGNRRRASVRFSSEPRNMLSTTARRAGPSRMIRSTRWLPMKPAPGHPGAARLRGATIAPMDGALGRVCSRCVYDEKVPGIEFGLDGVCNYCRLHDQMDRQYPTGEAGDRILGELAATMRAAGRGHRYDCVVGVSGGCDSSYMLWKMVELGVRPLAVHFDNTWNSPIATQNIYNVLDHLGIELHTLVVNSKEY